MGLLKSNPHPFVANTPNPFPQELEAARSLFEREIDSMDGWEGEAAWDELGMVQCFTELSCDGQNMVSTAASDLRRRNWTLLRMERALYRW